MKPLIFSLLFAFAVIYSGCDSISDKSSKNPFFTTLNTPVDYASVTASDIEDLALVTLKEVDEETERIRQVETPTFENVFKAMDDANNKLLIASNNCHMLYLVSPDSLSRVKGFEGYQLMDSLNTANYSDKRLFEKMISFTASEEYRQLSEPRKNLVDETILNFKQSGVNLQEDKLVQFKNLSREIGELSSEYSNNMNASNDFLELDEKGAEGLPEILKSTYKTEDGHYKIPVINATAATVLANADNEETRKAFYFKFYNRAADSNVSILEQLVQKRYELAKIMGYNSYASYKLVSNMAKTTGAVWTFLNDLVSRSKELAMKDLELLNKTKQKNSGSSASGPVMAWDYSYYNNQIIKTQFEVDFEKIREYLPMESCLKGMFSIYQELLGLEFRKVENPSVWDKEVELYEVYENNILKGRFYLDMFPRPNKESWFYGVNIIPGRAIPGGTEVPVAMMLGNFTRPTETLPSLLSHRELRTLFHEFGHIVTYMSYDGEFASQGESKADFGEAMSQLFENWIWDYDMLKTFAIHYKTGEVLPEETFNRMLKARDLGSGLSTITQLRRCFYDMDLYDRYNPEAPVNTDDIWKNIDKEMGIKSMSVDGTHYQASWIHVNTHPVYYYGYLWAEVYAMDMFTLFEQNGLLDQETGVKYRKLILANGIQRDIVGQVEAFLGRPSNNKAYFKHLGLD